MRRFIPALFLVVLLAGCSASPPETMPETKTASPMPVRPSIGYADLANAPVPSLCGFQPGRLENGEYAGDKAAAAPPEAYAEYAQFSLEDDQEGVHWAVADEVEGDGVAAVSAVYCDLGGVAWPENVVAYDADLHVLGAVNLGKVVRAQNSVIRSLAIEDGKVTVVWDTQGPGDASVERSVRATATFVPHDGALVPRSEVRQEPIPVDLD